MAFFHQGFLRVACAVPVIKVADPEHNAAQVCNLLMQAEADDVALVVFPELCLTGYTCGDLFTHARLQQAAVDALRQVLDYSKKAFHGVAVVGLPLVVNDQLFNVAAVVHAGHVLGVIPKTYLPNYKEFYEARWFSPATRAASFDTHIQLLDQVVNFGVGQCISLAPRCTIGVEICEDLWVPEPPSGALALQGASVLCNLSASNDLIGKAAWRRELVTSQSGRCIAAYLYASCGPGESSTDLVYGGHCLIAENGALLSESSRLERSATLLISEIDLERLAHDRITQGSYADWNLTPAGMSAERRYADHVEVNLPKPHSLTLRHRIIDPHPFVPANTGKRGERCAEIFAIQVAALAQRLDHVGSMPLSLGVSGGLDSTLALLVACKTLDQLKRPRTDLQGLTMPGFGTSRRTLENARTLLKHLGVAWQEIDIRGLCLEEMRLLGHQPFGIDCDGLDVESLAAKLQTLPKEKCQDLTFENVQARMRTNLLMNRGFVIGTSDLSELAVGWCTYNGDHMSMYNPNVAIPKTLVKWLISYVADADFSGPTQAALRDVLATEISPELLPLAADGSSSQSTEATIGPYELLDFFLYHFLRYGTEPDRLLYLAEQARFDRSYSKAELSQWLRVFLKRFFTNQFKRSCLPDGPKVGTVSLSPRGDWRMPSDASVRAWLEE